MNEDGELTVAIALSDGASMAKALDVLSAFDPKEETNLTGLRNVLTFVEPVAKALEPLLGFLKARKDLGLIESLEITTESGASFKVDRFHVDNAESVSALATQIVAALETDGST